MQETIYATIGDTLAISANINTKDDIIVDKVEFSCNDLYIQRDLVKLDNNLYSCEFKPYETRNFKCGFYTATISVYIGDIITSKTISLYVQDNPNREEININPQVVVVTPTEETQVILPNEGQSLLKVTINPIPSDYSKTEGELVITEQGRYDVKNKESVLVKSPFDRTFQQLVNGTLTNITAEDLEGVTKINDYAFYNQKQLRKFEVPSTLQVLGMYVFSGTINLTQPLYLPPTVKMLHSSNYFSNTFFSKIKCGGPLNQQIGYYFVIGAYAKIVEFNEGTTTFLNDVFQSNGTVKKCILPSTTVNIQRINYYQTLIIKAELPPALSQSTQICSRAFVPYATITEYKNATNWTALTLYPLVKNYEDLASVDTTTYNYACVIGNDLGIEDENNYKIYQYIDGQWYEVVQ